MTSPFTISPLMTFSDAEYGSYPDKAQLNQLADPPGKNPSGVLSKLSF